MRKLLLTAALLLACGHRSAPQPTTPEPQAAPKKRVRATPLSREEIVAGLEPARPKARACFARHNQAGQVLVRIRIAPSGAVEARTLGKARGSPASACIERAVRQSAFRPSTGLLLDYPFQP